MPIIKPVSDLRNNFNEISEICHNNDEPVYITKNGQGDLVVMSMASYDKMESIIELYQKLGEAELESQSNVARISHKDMLQILKVRING